MSAQDQMPSDEELPAWAKGFLLAYCMSEPKRYAEFLAGKLEIDTGLGLKFWCEPQPGQDND